MPEVLQPPLGRSGCADGSESEELRRYTEACYDLGSLGGDRSLPLADEPFVPCWEAWEDEAKAGRGVVEVLRRHLPQLAFPVREGVSASEDYRAATRRGVDPAELPSATGLPLERPGAVELSVHQSPAGRIPVLLTPVRRDFITLVRALARRNEPTPVPDSQGAVMVSGFNNWARVAALRHHWEGLAPDARETATWPEELGRISRQPELFRDRFIVLFAGPYSGVPAADLGLEPAHWLALSLAIRREHECAHYLTRRLFGAMRNHALDELVADYAGLVAATGRFRADWFLRFLGIDREDRIRPDGRLHIYRGDPPLSDRAFRALWRLLRAAAENLERADASWLGKDRSLAGRGRAITALASLRLEEIAAPDLRARLGEHLRLLAPAGAGG